MSAEITIEDAVANLKSMFSAADEEVILALLEANGITLIILVINDVYRCV